MLVHLGSGVSVHSREIVSMTDLQQPLSQDTAALLDHLSRRRRVRRIGESHKTMVLTNQDHHTVCYLSPIGIRTLRLRMEEETALLVQLAARQADTRNEVQT